MLQQEDLKWIKLMYQYITRNMSHSQLIYKIDYREYFNIILKRGDISIIMWFWEQIPFYSIKKTYNKIFFNKGLKYYKPLNSSSLLTQIFDHDLIRDFHLARSHTFFNNVTCFYYKKYNELFKAENYLHFIILLQSFEEIALNHLCPLSIEWIINKFTSLLLNADDNKVIIDSTCELACQYNHLNVAMILAEYNKENMINILRHSIKYGSNIKILNWLFKTFVKDPNLIYSKIIPIDFIQKIHISDMTMHLFMRSYNLGLDQIYKLIYTYEGVEKYPHVMGWLIGILTYDMMKDLIAYLDLVNDYERTNIKNFKLLLSGKIRLLPKNNCHYLESIMPELLTEIIEMSFPYSLSMLTVDRYCNSIVTKKYNEMLISLKNKDFRAAIPWILRNGSLTSIQKLYQYLIKDSESVIFEINYMDYFENIWWNKNQLIWQWLWDQIPTFSFRLYGSMVLVYDTITYWKPHTPGWYECTQKNNNFRTYLEDYNTQDLKKYILFDSLYQLISIGNKEQIHFIISKMKMMELYTQSLIEELFLSSINAGNIYTCELLLPYVSFDKNISTHILESNYFSNCKIKTLNFICNNLNIEDQILTNLALNETVTINQFNTNQHKHKNNIKWLFDKLSIIDKKKFVKKLRSNQNPGAIEFLREYETNSVIV